MIFVFILFDRVIFHGYEEATSWAEHVSFFVLFSSSCPWNNRRMVTIDQQLTCCVSPSVTHLRPTQTPSNDEVQLLLILTGTRQSNTSSSCWLGPWWFWPDCGVVCSRPAPPSSLSLWETFKSQSKWKIPAHFSHFLLFLSDFQGAAH